MTEEPDHLQETTGGSLPLGVRLTDFFLGAMVVILTLMTAVAGLACFASLVAVAHESRDALSYVAGAAAILGIFCAVLAALLGVNWLSMTVRAPHENAARAQWPHHPLRAIVRPLFVAGWVYSFFAMMAWIAVRIISSGTWSSWIWLCSWVAFGIGCHLVICMIDRNLETQ